MQLNSANELHFVRHHVPGERCACNGHCGALQTATRFANGGEGFRQEFVERFGNGVAQFAFGTRCRAFASEIVVDALALGGVNRHAFRSFEFGNARFDRRRALG